MRYAASKTLAVILVNLLINFNRRVFSPFYATSFLHFRSYLMKSVFLSICLLICGLPIFAQNTALPKKCQKILKETFPAFRYANDWDYEDTQIVSAAYSADWNRDGKTDYGVFIEFEGQYKLVIFFSSGKNYKFFAIERETVLALGAVETDDKNMKRQFYKKLPEKFKIPKDSFGSKILKEYGALFVAKTNAVLPKSVIFKDEKEVAKFQENVSISRFTVGKFEIELQTSAMDALKNAIAEAEAENLTITTRDYDSGRRGYNETVGLWYSRVEPALDFWTSNGKISISEAERLRTLSLSEQIPEIFKLEEQGIYFSKDLSKPIMYSVAPPGTSQHLSMLAIDINEFDIPAIQQIMARNGWHQTVISDLPHFTFLGANEDELAALGLRKVISGGRSYWIPNI